MFTAYVKIGAKRVLYNKIPACLVKRCFAPVIAHETDLSFPIIFFACTVLGSEIVTGQAAQARLSQIWEMGCLNNSKFSCNV